MCDVHCEFMRRETPVAQKDYRCDECRKPIPAGTKHSAVVGKWDGEVRTYRAHTECRALADSLRDDDGCFLLGQLMEAPGSLYATSSQVAEWERLTGRKWHGDVEEVQP